MAFGNMDLRLLKWFRGTALLKILLTVFIFLCSFQYLFSQDGSYYCSRSKINYSLLPEMNSLPGYNSDTTIDVTYYQLGLNIFLTPVKYISGVTNVFFKVSAPQINHFFLDFSANMTVDSVKSGNLNFTFNHSQDKINIITDRVYSLNEILQVVVYYHGAPVASGFGSFVMASNNTSPVIWTLSEPFGASDWFPCKNTPSDKSDSSSVIVTCIGNLTVVSNGILKNITQNSDSTKTYYWFNSYPISNYLISIAVTDYSLYKNYFRYSPVDSMTVYHYIYPQFLNQLIPLLDKTIPMLKLFSEKFGMYPFIREKYAHAQFGVLGGMEHQTATSIGYFSEGVIAHELAHQWFGDKITCRDWHNIWLNEGFATYSEGVYRESTYGNEQYKEFVRAVMADAKKATGSVYVQDISSVQEIFNGFRSYSKGAVILHMLRGVTGDSAFFRIMKAYAEKPKLAYSTAVTQDFKSVADSVLGLNLGYFFDEWVYGENYPYYYINWSYENNQNNFYDVHLTLTQKTNTNPLYFTMPADIKVTTKNSDTIIKIFNNSQTQNYTFTVTGKPQSLKFDPDNKILKDKNGDEDYVSVSYSIGQNYPNPFNPSTTINYEIAGSNYVKIYVYDIAGKEIRALVNGKQSLGKYSVVFDGKDLSSGVYFYKIEVTQESTGVVRLSDSRKMVLLR